MTCKTVSTKGFSAPLKGEILVPPDKSMSHRSLIIGSLTKGKIKISNFLKSADCLATLEILKELGAEINFLDEKTLVLDTKNAYKPPKKELYCGNSGTTMRLLTGLLAGANLECTLTGDISLSKRPMKRIIDPLTKMGASLKSNEGKAPLIIQHAKLNGIEYISPIASAQVKSCILLAGVQTPQCATTVLEPHLSRDHTERMLKFFNADIETYQKQGLFGVTVRQKPLVPQDLNIMGDISSAAFIMVAASVVKNSEVILRGVGLNSTRTGIVDVMKKMGAEIEILDERLVSNEPVGDIRVKYSPNLVGCEIGGEIIPRLIDEIPIIALLATQAEGVTRIKDASDLRNKESDRITSVTRELRKFGANIEATEDGLIIEGKSGGYGLFKQGAEVESFHDHRIAMMGYIAGLISEKPCKINGFEWVETSFPGFLKTFEHISA